ncbi:MAG: outer membrane protein transport protein [Thermodesulfobacteriota bacterium]
MPLVSCQRYLLGATIVLLASSLLLRPLPARATNGYWAHGYGPKSKAMAGAGAALPLDAMDAAQNPAKMVWLGNRMDLGLAAFMPDRSFTAGDDGGNGYPAISPGTHDSGNDIFFIPHLARNRMLDATSSLGISIGANGGMNTEYDAAVFSAFDNPGNTATSPTGIDFKQLFIGLTYARKIAANHSFGITPIAAAQSFKVTGLQPFQPFSSDPEQVTNNGYDYSYGGGVKIGWLSRITDSFSVGAAYQTKLWMSKFDDYRGLFAEQGNFDIPANFTAGLSWQMTPSLTLAADVQHILFEEVKSIGNSGCMVLRPGSIMLGTDDGIGFGWRNMTIGKFGLQWQCLTDLTLRAGYSTGNQPIAGEQALFNILAPAVVTEHYTLGLTRTFGNMELSLSLLYAPENKVSGTNPNTGLQTGSLAMSQYEVEIGIGFVF